jgi:outer membrane receptor protein involved in Fe transport
MIQRPARSLGVTLMSNSLRFHVPSTAAFALAIIVCAMPIRAAFAASEAAAEAATEATPEGGLETIVVTARKRTESVQDVPVDVTAVTGEEIRRQDLTSLEKLAEVTPDFNVGRASNGSAAQLTLRGIGSSSTSIGIEQSVAVVVDDVYYGQGRIIEEGFFDLGEVSILKGPQALFFGKNATAGVIALTSADPTNTAELMTKAAYEIESKTTQVEAVASGPLTDTLGVRVAVRGSIMNGGYYKNEADDVTYSTFDSATHDTTEHVAGPAPSDSPGEHELLARATVKWTPTDQLTATLKLSSDYNYVNNSSWNYVAYSCPTGSLALNAQWACGNSFITHQNDMPTDIAQNYPYADGGGTYNRYQSYAATLTLNYKLDDYTLTSVSNYQTNNNTWLCSCDFESSGPTGVWATEDSTWYAASEEFRALSTFHFPVNFMVGALAQKTMRVFNQWVTDGGVSNSDAPAGDEYVTTAKYSTTEGKTYSVFGQAIWQVVPTVEATAGLRYTHETKDSFFTQPYNNPLVTAIFRPENVPFGQVTADQLFTNVSPEATISWKPVQDIMFYGAYKTGYKSGGFDNSGINSAAIPANPATYMTFRPEKAKGFEIGAKTTTLEHQLRVNLELFDYKYTDLQVDFFNSPIFAFQTVSADARTAGAELDVDFAPRAVSGLTLHTTLIYDEAKYTSFNGPCYAGQTPAEGCTIPSPTLPFQPLSGAPLGMSPLFTGTAGARYDLPLGGGGLHLASNLDARYSDAYLASSFNNPTSRQASYVVVDAGLRLITDGDKYEFAVVGKNLTNRFYVNGVVDGPETGSGTGTPAGIRADQLGFGNLPRTIQFQVVGRFGL